MCDKINKRKNRKREIREKMGKTERNGREKELEREGLFREDK